jgi:crotonobetainyl-CoA:carnitine CoA-transferase CaiB-like acyl-CoA transferase
MSGGPLQGLRILDLSNVVAGPWAATLLGDFGAEIVKVEMPKSGDPLRALAPHKDGVGLWWKVANRNKKGVTIDLRKTEGQELVRRLVPHFDVLIENYRPGTLDKWQLSKDTLLALNPRLVILRITAFGQTGPYRDRPGFARVAEGMAGFTNLCGEADGPPLHVGYPVADGATGIFGALAIMMALYPRIRNPEAPGQEIDLSLFDSMFRLLDFLPVEYDQLGLVRSRSGNRSQYGAPGNVYRTADGEWASIAASSQNIFERLARAMNQPELITDPRFRTNPDRVRNNVVLDEIIGAWIAQHTFEKLGAILDEAEVGFAPIYSIAQIFSDPHAQARQAVISVPDDELGRVAMQNVVPRFSLTPGEVRRAGPRLGEHNREIFQGMLGLSNDEFAELEQKGAV